MQQISSNHIFPPSLFHHNRQTKNMANIRHCPTCKVVFRSIDAVNDHYKKTSHTPLPYKCESCEKVYKQSSSLQKVGIQLFGLVIDLSISWAHTPMKAYPIETSKRVISLQMRTLQPANSH